MLFHITEAAAVVVVAQQQYTMFRKNIPFVFFITFSQFNHFAQKFQHL